jgi:hypothetical protein
VNAGALRLAVLLLAACAATSALAGSNTYAVCGYTGVPPRIVTPCAQPRITSQHFLWHFHFFVTDGRECAVCFDEEDATCNTVFIANSSTYRAAEDHECARLGEMHSNKVIAHVVDGVAVVAPPPPPLSLASVVDSVGPGPYTAGDTVKLEGSVRAPDGSIHAVKGGSFTVTLADGSTQSVPARRLADGRFAGEFQLPPTSGAKVQFVADGAGLAQNERLDSPTSADTVLKVEACTYRARVISPSDGESLASGQQVELRAELLDGKTGQPLGAIPAGLALSFSATVGSGQATQLPAAPGALTAQWVPPSTPAPTQVKVSAGGSAGPLAVCPAGEVAAPLSELGLSFDVKGPATCYVGLPCEGSIRVKRPAPGPSRARLDSLLAAPGLEWVLTDTGREAWRGALPPSDEVPVRVTYDRLGAGSWKLSAQLPGGAVSSVPHQVKVRPALELRLASSLDFGEIEAGSATNTVCQQLDFSKSTAVEEHKWTLKAAVGSALSVPMLQYLTTFGYPDHQSLLGKVPVDELDPVARFITVCLDVPACAGDESPSEANLEVTPLTPEFANQARTVALRWKVRPLSWFRCHRGWVLPAAAVLLGLFVLGGLVRPARFPLSAAVRVSGSEKELRRAIPQVLRECPGAAAGFYRDARLGLSGDGDLSGKVAGCAVRFRAVRGEGWVIQGTGPLEFQDRRTRAWMPVTDLEPGHVPLPGITYRQGSTYFVVES